MSQISGPGFGAGSSIGSVSVDVVANTTHLNTGLQDAQRQTEAFATATAAKTTAAVRSAAPASLAGGGFQAWQNAGQQTGRAFSGGLVQEVGRGTKFVQKLLTGAGTFALIGAAYHIGVSIGERIAEGIDVQGGKIRDRVEKLASMVQEGYENAVDRANDAITGRGQPKIDTEVFKQAQREYAEVTRLKREYEGLRDFGRLDEEGLKRLSELVTKHRELSEQVQRVTTENNNYNKSLSETKSLESAIAAQREVGVQKLTTTIERLGALIELQTRQQRFPTLPGSGTTRSER